MSELYSVHIEAVHEGEVTFRVTTIHPDAGPPPEDATFPMNLLIDLWGLLDRGFVSLIKGCKLGAEQAIALARDPAYATRMAALRGLACGREEQCSAADIRDLERQMTVGEPPRLRGLEVQGWGGAGKQQHVFLPADPGGFAGAIAPLVDCCAVDEHENDGAYDDWPRGKDAPLPRVRIWLALRDPALLGFVRAGWRFDSASYY
ncbi:MAG TPA: hypothetical protein VGB85_01720 [Nannocystis sp.]